MGGFYGLGVDGLRLYRRWSTQPAVDFAHVLGCETARRQLQLDQVQLSDRNGCGRQVGLPRQRRARRRAIQHIHCCARCQLHIRLNHTAALCGWIPGPGAARGTREISEITPRNGVARGALGFPGNAFQALLGRPMQIDRSGAPARPRPPL